MPEFGTKTPQDYMDEVNEVLVDVAKETLDDGRHDAEIAPQPTENAREPASRLSKEQADKLMAERAAMLRGKVLEGPLAALRVEDPEQWAQLLEQLDQMEADRSEDLKAGEPLARELIKIFEYEGGDPGRPLAMLKTAEADAGVPAWFRKIGDELAEEVAKEATLEVLKEHVHDELAEAALEVLALVFAVPTGPVGAVLLAAHAMKLLEAAGPAAR